MTKQQVFNELNNSIKIVYDNFCVTTIDCSFRSQLMMADLPTFKLTYGATKAVIVFEDLPFVVKFPFFVDSMIEPDELESWYEESDVEPHEEFFSEWDYYHDIENYCEEETNRYKIAVSNCVGDFFAAEEFFGTLDCGLQVYFQERAMPCDNMEDELYRRNFIGTIAASNISRINSHSAKPLSDKKKDIIDCFPSKWFEKVLDYFPPERIADFIDVLINEEFLCSDFRTCNVGFIGERPVLIDYSGYVY